MLYTDHTSSDLARLASKAIAVLPLAAIEQHGNHLPVATDTAIADELARRVEAALPKRVMLLPTLWCGSSHHHRGFPGALSISSETYTRVIEDLLDCLIESGFRRIFLLNCHGGNQTPFAEALYRVNLRHPEPWVAAASYWNLAAKELAAQKFMETPKLSHACEYETSLMLRLRVDWVKPGRRGQTRHVVSKYYDPLNYVPSRVAVAQSFDQLSATGALGSPELATAEKGESLFALLADSVVDFLHDFCTWKRPKMPR